VVGIGEGIPFDWHGRGKFSHCIRAKPACISGGFTGHASQRLSAGARPIRDRWRNSSRASDFLRVPAVVSGMARGGFSRQVKRAQRYHYAAAEIFSLDGIGGSPDLRKLPVLFLCLLCTRLEFVRCAVLRDISEVEF